MTNSNSNHIISVDSESGTYWHGERKLRTQEQINAIINRTRPQVVKSDIAKRGQFALLFTAMNLIRTVSICFRTRILRLN